MPGAVRCEGCCCLAARSRVRNHYDHDCDNDHDHDHDVIDGDHDHDDNDTYDDSVLPLMPSERGGRKLLSTYLQGGRRNRSRA